MVGIQRLARVLVDDDKLATLSLLKIQSGPIGNSRDHLTGDEMNIHVPASPETEAELRLLSATKWNIISAQSSKPNICIVQDALVGAYLMTHPHQNMSREQFLQIASFGDWSIDHILNKIQHIRKVLKKLGKKVQAFNGRGLFSLLLPNDLNYEMKTGADDKEPIVKIYRGVLYEGVVNKSVLGSSHNSLIQILHKEYNEDVCVNFVNNVQFIVNNWLIYHGFSVGLSDCIATKKGEIEDVILKTFIEAKSIDEEVAHPRIKEIKVNGALSRARDHGMKIAKDALPKNNNFISTVTSGSKGDYFNIAQITGLLGQQLFSGQRIQPTLNQNKRTLVHYPVNIKDKEMEFESRGFIKNSFIRGLNPREFWMHCITGREGVTDTAMKTAQSGYIQRRLVKIQEDLQIKYDGTVRNTNNSIVQFAYGQDTLDASQCVVVGGKPAQVCDVGRLVDRLNTEYEN